MLKGPSRRCICTCGRVVERKSETCSNCKEVIKEFPSPDLVACAQYGLLDELQALVEEADQDVNSRDDVGATPLHWASMNGSMDIIRYLTSFESLQIDALGGDLQASPLYWAVRQNQIYAANALLQHGANLTLPDINGVDSLFLAVQCERVIMTAFLVASKADVNSLRQDNSNMTPLMWICRYRRNMSVIWALLNLHASVNLQDKDGNTALHYAVMNKNRSAAKSLLEFGADHTIRNAKGETPLESGQEDSSVCLMLDSYQLLQNRMRIWLFRVG